MSDLPERYAYAVTRNLPEAQRDEVAKELQTTIEDMASDRSKKGKPTEADIKAALNELGDPAVLAHKYGNTKRYLIGPRWYDAWWQLLKLLLSFIPAIVASVILAVGLAEGGPPIITSIVRAIGTGLMVGVNIAFWVTVVFAFMERGALTIKPSDLNPTTGWSPDDLPELPQHPERQISVVESITSAVLVALGVAWLSAVPWLHVKDGIGLINGSLWDIWMPILFGLATLTIVHEIAKAKIGNWTTPLMVANVLLAVASIVFVLLLVTTQQIVNPEYLRAWGVDTSAEGFSKALNWTTGITAASIVFVHGWSAVQSIILNRSLGKKA
jgi:hypothetical protein